MTDEEAIDEIMDHFDFDRVREIMGYLDWEWADLDDNKYFPKVHNLRMCARSLLRSACEHGTEFASSGGFSARRYKEGSLSLEFVVVEWDTL